MTLTRETIAEASEAARTAVAYLGEEERWDLLRKWLQKEPAGRRKAGRRSLRLEALRSIVCPRVNDREWDNVVREREPVQWADELRLANAFAFRSPEPAPLETPKGLTVEQSAGERLASVRGTLQQLAPNGRLRAAQPRRPASARVLGTSRDRGRPRGAMTQASHGVGPP